jgi:CsoR family transcriptional regulator, copper-sensing transcriptional repressor
LTTGGMTGVLLGGMGTTRRPPPLRVIDEAFVPDERKEELRARLKRTKGQVEGLERMLEDNRPCVEILTQLTATHEALKGVSRLMVRNYLERCAASAIKAGREREVYDELMKVIFKLAR